MKREIKFRGVSKESGKFVYGLPKIIKNAAGEVVAVYICYFTKSFKLVEDEILPETLEEYTSLKDKNKTEIYEGDVVVQYETPNSSYGIKQEIFFSDGLFWVGKKGETETPLYLKTNTQYRGKNVNLIEVVGTIHAPKLRTAKDVLRAIYGNGLYEVVHYDEEYKDDYFKFWVKGKDGYPPLEADKLKKELEKYKNFIVQISEDNTRLSVEVKREIV